MKFGLFTPGEWEDVQARLNRPPNERFQALVDRGIIDAQGKVLVRMPYFPGDHDEPEEDSEIPDTTEDRPPSDRPASVDSPG